MHDCCCEESLGVRLLRLNVVGYICCQDDLTKLASEDVNGG